MPRAALLHVAALRRHALTLVLRLPHPTAAAVPCCAPAAGSGARLQVLLRRGYRSGRPSASENSALLRELEAALKDPDAIQRLSTLLTPSTARNLSKALSNVQYQQQQNGSFETTSVGAAARQEPSAAGVGAAAIATASSSSQPATVSIQDLKYVALQYGLPFVGFGFVDNAIMILAGDYIDITLGVSLGISSMAAAGIGNTISDIAGLGLGNVVEDMCARLGLPIPALTQEQLMLKQTRWAKVVGSSIGVTIGCLLGMTPLLFLETREDHAKRAEEERTSKNSSNVIDIRAI